MRAAAVLLLLSLGAWPALSPADAVRDSLVACIQAFDAAAASAKKGLDEENPAARWVNLDAMCPGLREQIEASPYAAWLPRDWAGEKVQGAQLAELDRLLAAAQTDPSAAVAAPDTRAVAGVLKNLRNEEETKERSLWERFTAWLAGRLQGQSNREQPSWLDRWLEKLNLSSAGAKGFTKLLLLLVVIGAVLAIVNELRAAGVLRRKRGATQTTPDGSAAVMAGASAQRDVDAAELRLQPSLLLDLFLEKQAARQPQAGNSSLTHRELGAAVRLEDAERQSDFVRLAGCAERTRYAAADPAESELTAAVAAGRRLLAGFAIA